MKNVYLFLLLALLVAQVNAQVGIGTVSPNSTLDLRGSFSAAYRSFTTATSLISSDHTLVFTGGSATTATLPDATTCQGRIYCIKNFSARPLPAALTLSTVAAQKIDGLASRVLDELNETMMIGSDGANWEVLDQSSPATTGGSWNEGGNSVTSIKSIGTISNYDFPFITNNTEKMRITSAGNVGIGSTAFSANPEALLVYQNNATSFNVIAGKGNLNNYLQLNIQNLNSGTNASSDVVATADNGNELTNYVDMGMNSSGNTSGVMGAPDDAYLYTAGNNFLMGTANAGKALVFLTGGTTQATNERMRIDGTGNVGIGNNNPGYLLDVNGAIHTGKASATNGSLVFSNSTNANTITLNTGVTTATYAITLPTAQGGVNTVLGNNGAGILSWTTVAAAANTWSTLGNAGTTPGTNFLGTTDNQSLMFKANNLLAGKIDLPLNNALFGSQAGNAVTTGNNNTFLGYQSGLLNTTGPSNTGVGSIALVANIGGSGNTAIGYAALKGNTTGGSNTALGNSAGLTNTTGSNNTFVGTNADATVVGLSNASAIGYNAKVATSNTLILGGTGASIVNVGIGTNTFNVANPEKLVVDAGATASVNAIVGKGTINNYLQLNIQNLSNGASASSDVVATADNGNETSNYVDMGINGSANASGVMGNPDDAYLYNIGQNFLFGTGTAAKSLVFMTGGTTQATNERMRISGSGNVGIGNNNPAATLDVNGTVKVGTAGTILNSIIRFTNQSITDNTSITYNQTLTETFALTGVNKYATVIVTPRTALPTGLGIAYSYAPAANTVQVTFTNASGANLSLGTIAFDITVIQ